MACGLSCLKLRTSDKRTEMAGGGNTGGAQRGPPARPFHEVLAGKGQGKKLYPPKMYGNDAAIFDDERRGKNRKRRISYGFSLVKGRSKHQMEDHHVAQFRSFRQEHELGLFAIFDGHLGHSVAIYLQHHLFDNILSHPKFWSDPRVALTEAYEKTDSEIIQRTKELGRGGSTAVTAIVIDGQKLIVANVGDSRAVACRDDAAIQLTVDHEPGKEKVSIEGMGGFVSVIPGDIPRLDGQLAVSRAFGDKSLKMHVRSDPDVCIRDIDAATEFMILASDGLWKVMDNQTAVNHVKLLMDPQKGARKLTSEAVALGSTDDISCIVVSFR